MANEVDDGCPSQHRTGGEVCSVCHIKHSHTSSQKLEECQCTAICYRIP